MSEINFDSLRENLKNNVVVVTFTKSDGTTRVLRATLKPDLLPQTDGSKELRNWVPNPSVLPVFDIDLQEWRSFRIDSVTGIVVE